MWCSVASTSTCHKRQVRVSLTSTPSHDHMSIDHEVGLDEIKPMARGLMMMFQT